LAQVAFNSVMKGLDDDVEYGYLPNKALEDNTPKMLAFDD
jgi:hypothetical protein